MNCLLTMRKSVLFVVVVIASGSAQGANDLDVPIPHQQCSGNLPEVLRFIAEKYRVPVIAELIYPLPEKVVIEAGQDSAIALLARVLPQVPGYSYRVTGGHIIHFYEKRVVNRKNNLLNMRIAHFTMPADLSDFKLLLPAAINSARRGLPTVGSVISGFPSKEMERIKLTPKEFSEVSGRELLIAAAEETLAFYSITVLPGKSCSSDGCFDYANKHWFWGSLSGAVSTSRIYIQPPAPPAN